MSKFFPIKTETSCQAKWAWSTLYLNSGITCSCHRTSKSELTVENFDNFHNTLSKLEDRRAMLQGKWPDTNCSYCKNLEENGSVSDRISIMNAMEGVSPVELESNSTEVVVNPTIVEVFFNNTCNLGCLYCHANLSSVISAENIKFGEFKKNGVEIIPNVPHFKELVPSFWKWFDKSFSTVKRLHVLGGEPFYQKEFYQLLDKLETTPNSDCEINIVTNLMIDNKKLQSIIDKFKNLLVRKKIKRIDITCSLDCWGKEQEFVRYGLDIKLWEKNFETLLKHKWLYLSVNQTISSLTIKTMPGLLEKINTWRQQRQVNHFFSIVSPGPTFMHPSVLERNEFSDDFRKILSLMPQTTTDDIKAYKYMESIKQLTESSKDINIAEVIKLITYLDEMDRRRGTQWENVFPWLIKYKHYVVQ